MEPISTYEKDCTHNVNYNILFLNIFPTKQYNNMIRLCPCERVKQLEILKGLIGLVEYCCLY